MNKNKRDFASAIFSKTAYWLHPKFGKFYDEHTQLVNDGVVEALCLVIANIFVWYFSYLAIGFPLVLMLLLVATPITFALKYVLHKRWVWIKNNE